MREYEERREIENTYEKAKKRIKELIEARGLSMKGSAKGAALSEILAVFDKELEIDIAEELVTARRLCREYYKKYTEVEALETKYRENEQKLKEQAAVANMVSLLTDNVLKDAIIAYNSMSSGRYGRGNDAKDIVIAYITSKGREDLREVIDAAKGGEA